MLIVALSIPGALIGVGLFNIYRAGRQLDEVQFNMGLMLVGLGIGILVGYGFSIMISG